ncbi:hypothetical protein Dimus_017788, partial [Dionaea muscipula]
EPAMMAARRSPDRSWRVHVDRRDPASLVSSPAGEREVRTSVLAGHRLAWSVVALHG